MTSVDTLLVGFTKNPKGNDILIIGRKFVNGALDVINAFEGPEARHIYEKLIGKGDANGRRV